MALLFDGTVEDDGKGVKESQPVAEYGEQRWGAFLSGTGEWVSVGNTDNARGYDLTSGGFTLGIDYKITPNFAMTSAHRRVEVPAAAVVGIDADRHAAVSRGDQDSLVGRPERHSTDAAERDRDADPRGHRLFGMPFGRYRGRG